MKYKKNGYHDIERIYVCTSKQAKLHRFYLLKTGDNEKEIIYKTFRESLKLSLNGEKEIENYNQESLIQDLPYKIKFSEIKSDSYLYEFKSEITSLIKNKVDEIIQFKKFGELKGKVSNFEEKEGLKFLVIQFKKDLLFLSIATNSIIKDKPLIKLSVTKDTTIVEIDKGIQVPPTVTARFNIDDQELFVYDVNKFEKMLTLNENVKAKSKDVLRKFKDGTFKVGEEEFRVIGLEDTSVNEELLKSARSMRRLSKYSNQNNQYEIEKIKNAVDKLQNENQKVEFVDEDKIIKVSKESAKTFVAIIHNSIIERLISGDVEITI